ncbi:type 2 lanthipeptide synthetase LanM family protein [Lentzea sp. NPDC005914]|uniref:type 2 lanthipeptide synthetase LanM family protein n=1 Tax=Lentzea sp. NPDC005914 TaxID=3154572 RepID=UPI0033DAD54D
MRLDDSSWYRGLTLAERLPVVRAEGACAERAARRFSRWRTQPPFDQDEWFSRRLAADGITEGSLQALLGEDDAALGDRVEAPAWLDGLAAFGESEGEPEFAGFSVVAEPLLRRARSTVAGVMAEVAGPLDPALAPELVRVCVEAGIGPLVERTLALELNVARLRGELSGDSPADRYRDFVRGLRDPAALFAEYPVLGRLLAGHVSSGVAALVEFLRRLGADWAEICARFPGDHGVLSTVESDLGDRHRGGRTVMLATFSGGLRLVYKPRSLAADRHFQTFLVWVNDRVRDLGLRTFGVLDRGDHGWTEFVGWRSCEDETQVSRFYRRLGAQLAIMHALGGTDLHYENVIAAGEHPVVVDLESLFQPEVHAPTGTDFATRAVVDSVLRVGLLPKRAWGHDGAPGIDVSGLGTHEDQLSPRAAQYWTAVNTDEMRIERKRLPISGGQNRPSLRGADVNAADFADDLLSGFQDTYRALRTHRDELLAVDGPLSWFTADEIRVIVRPTHVYSLMLRESVHPDLLRDGLDRERFFDKLWVSVSEFPLLERVIAAERADLWRGDVPMFVTRPSSRDVWTSSGSRVADFLGRSGFELVRERIAALSDVDLEWQGWIVRGSLTALSLSDGTDVPRDRIPRMRRPVSDFLSAAQAVGDRLDQLAIRQDGAVSWLGLTAFQERYWNLSTLGADLYSGLSGIALFLARLGAAARDARYTALAEGALTMVRRHVDQSGGHGKIGAYSGRGSAVYLYTHLGVLWRRPDLLDEASSLAVSLGGLIDSDDQFDVLGGCAGAIGVLAGLQRQRPDPALVYLMLRCGERLLDAARPTGPDSCGWVTPLADRPLTGLGHGAAGIGSALAVLAEVTGQRRFAETASAALAYERAMYLPEQGNWPDLRDDPPTCMTAWCHGAVGVGLARLALPSAWRGAREAAEIAQAVETTLAHGFGANHSLCHGDLGSLDLLLAAGRPEAGERGRAVLESIGAQGWLCGTPRHAETPGLLNGLAGIGYGLLRAADPAGVPSVLMLEPPAGD